MSMKYRRKGTILTYNSKDKVKKKFENILINFRITSNMYLTKKQVDQKPTRNQLLFIPLFYSRYRKKKFLKKNL